MEVASGFLGQVFARLDQYDTRSDGPPGIVGLGLRNPDGSPQGSVGNFPNLARTIREQFIPRSRRKYQPGWRIRQGPVDWVTGACMLVNSTMIAELGGMDEDFFLYHEEVAFSREAHNRGWRVEYDPGVTVIHRHPLQNRPISPMMRVITRHSKLLYFLKHLPRWQFESLAAIVSAEAVIKGYWSRLLHRREEARGWERIAEITRGLRRARTAGRRGSRSGAAGALGDESVERSQRNTRWERIDVQGRESPGKPDASFHCAERKGRVRERPDGDACDFIVGLLSVLVVARHGNLAWDDADYLRRGLTNARLAEAAGPLWVLPRAIDRLLLEQPKPPWLVGWIEFGVHLFGRKSIDGLILFSTVLPYAFLMAAVVFLGRRLRGAWGGFVALLCLAASPLSLEFGGKVMVETSLALWVLCIYGLTAFYLAAPTRGKAAALGLFVGLALLTKLTIASSCPGP